MNGFNEKESFLHFSALLQQKLRHWLATNFEGRAEKERQTFSKYLNDFVKVFLTIFATNKITNTLKFSRATCLFVGRNV
jgi:hypothetical protein